MSKAAARTYRFSSDAQWRSCEFVGVDATASASGLVLSPYAPLAVPPAMHAAPESCAPAVDRYGAITWHGDRGRLYRLSSCDESPAVRSAPSAVARAQRVVVNGGGLWVPGERNGSIECYEEETLARRLVVQVGDGPVVDLADDGREGVLGLTGADCHWHCVQVNCAGQVTERVKLAALLRPRSFEFLRDAGELVVLDDGHAGAWLRWYPRGGGSETATLFTPTLGTCFELDALGSDRRSRLFLAGADRLPTGAQAHVIVLDGAGDAINDFPLSARATGISGMRDGAAVTTANGLQRFVAAQVVPDGTPEMRCTVITPMLQAPATPDGNPWLRVEALGLLPPGTTMEFAWAVADDEVTRQSWRAVLDDATLSTMSRAQALRDLPGIWSKPLAVHGSTEQVNNPDVPIAAPLFGLHAGSLWIALTLIAPAGASLPSLRRLDVLYQGTTLMASLPSIYRKTEDVPGDFTRALVGVLETTTQTLDASIAMLGSHIAPDTAPGLWLDYVARWLGVPWDDGFDDAQKRAILQHADEIAKGRGTRAGLEALLSCLVPGSPPRYRVVDATADLGFSTLATSSGCGAALPVMLAGLQASATELGLKSVVGSMRLPCPGDSDDGTRYLKGRIRVDIAATAIERREWEPWIQSILEAAVPATTRLQVCWIHGGMLRSQRLDGETRLGDVPAAPELGTDAVTGQVRLPAGPISLPASGLGSDARLH
jgi:phage tail-like protein